MALFSLLCAILAYVERLRRGGILLGLVTMPEEDYIPLYKPPLRRHRLIHAGDAALPPDMPGTSEGGQAFTIGSSFPHAVPPAPLLAAQTKLADEAAHLVEEVMPQLEALQTALSARGTAEKTVETLALLSSALRVLPAELASGAETSVARVDWIFARLLNAPGQPGLIELVLLALLKPPAASPPVPSASPRASESLVDYAAEQEMLRRLHRDLVTLQQGWEDMLELTLPPEMLEPPPPLLFPAVEDAAPLADEAPAAPPSLASAPLPAGLVVAHPEAGWRASAPPVRSRPAALATIHPVLVMALIVVVLALTGGGVYMMQNLHSQPVSSNNAAVIAPLPSPTATATTQPTATPTATATTAPTATSTPRPLPTATNTPAPTATPAPAPGPLCASGIDLCSSLSTLQVPCSGQGSVTFQLTNGTRNTLTWVGFSSTVNGSSLVALSPSSGSLKQGRQVTVTVTARVHGQGLKGTLTIMAGFGNDEMLFIPLQVC